MNKIASRGVVCALLCALTLGWVGAGIAVSATPDGYQRVRVQGLPLSIALPDDWTTQTITPSDAKAMMELNPELAAQGMTVERLLAQAMTSGVDMDGDTYQDRYLTVQRVDSPGLPSPAATQAEFATVPTLRDITVKRTTVAKKPALLITYTQDLNRDDGAPFTASGTTYVFIPRGTRSVLMQFFQVDESDEEFAAIMDTMIKSVKIQ